VTRCRWVESRRAEGVPVTMACSVAGVSTRTFYDWLGEAERGPSARDLGEASLVNEIHDAHRASDATYGEPRITPILQPNAQPINHKRVERVMRMHGIAGVFKPTKVQATIPAEENPPVPDLFSLQEDVRRRDSDRDEPGLVDLSWPVIDDLNLNLDSDPTQFLGNGLGTVSTPDTDTSRRDIENRIVRNFPPACGGYAR
jgi:transposase InsO family protein